MTKVFSAAETKNPRENEPQSPLDASQLIFSANVNTGSWSYLRNMISMDRPIDKSFVRIEEILNFANKAAAITTSRHGAIPAMPTLAEMKEA